MDPKKTFNARFELEPLLRSALNLPFVDNVPNTASEIDFTDILFVCFDFENGQQIISHASSSSFGSRKILAQAGISILDPRNLRSNRSQKALTTHNFGFGGSPSHRRTVDRKFFFGETIWLCRLADLITSMEKLLDRSRNIVLVGHGLKGDCEVLRSLGFDFDNSIVGYLDTADAARTILSSSQDTALTPNTFRLKDLLSKLGLVVEGCHVAGNDANFTLRALLLLAVEAVSVPDLTLLSESTKNIVETIKAVGLESLPRLLPPPTSQAAKNSASKDSNAPIRREGWIYFGHLLEISFNSQQSTQVHKHHITKQPQRRSTLTHGDSCQSQSSDFQQPSDLLLQWCPRLENRR